jgi:hypothetical protein
MDPNNDPAVEEMSTAGVAADEAAAAAQDMPVDLNLGDITSFLSDPAAMAALQDHLQLLIGGPSGLMDDLPEAAQRRVRALKRLQKEHLDLELQYHAEVAALDQKYHALYQPLYEKRRAIITGEVEPTEEESVWPPEESSTDEPDAEGEGQGEGEASGDAPAEGDAEGAEASEEAAEETANGDEGEDEEPGLNKFWFNCLVNNEVIADLIQEHDEEVLGHLVDIRAEYLEGANNGFSLHFDFGENPYFTNTTLTKTYHLKPEPEDATDLIYEGPMFQKATGCEIDWKPDMNVTVKIVTKKQRKKSGPNRGQTRIVQRTVAQDSFFNFFSPPELDMSSNDEDQLAITANLLQTDYLVGDIILTKLIPNAVLWYTGEALDYEDDDEEEEEEEEDEDDDDDDYDEDPDWRPPAGAAGAQPPDCKQS